jgi:hypothetical protein
VKRISGNRYVTSVRALDNRYIYILRFPDSDALQLGITAEGSTYTSSAGLRKLRSDIDRHLRAMKGRKP